MSSSATKSPAYNIFNPIKNMLPKGLLGPQGRTTPPPKTLTNMGRGGKRKLRNRKHKTRKHKRTHRNRK